MPTNRELDRIEEGIKQFHYYTHGKLEPWDVIRDWKLDFFEGNVIKYFCRWRRKGGITDLKKARDYINELIRFGEEEEQIATSPKGNTTG